MTGSTSELDCLIVPALCFGPFFSPLHIKFTVVIPSRCLPYAGNLTLWEPICRNSHACCFVLASVLWCLLSFIRKQLNHFVCHLTMCKTSF